jgi:hypothetical protein
MVELAFGPAAHDLVRLGRAINAPIFELQERGNGDTTVVILTGLPCLVSGRPVVAFPDSLEHYRARDGSIVEVVRREYASGKFTTYIHQTWQDRSVYHGDCMLESLADLAKTCRPVPLQPTGVAYRHA